MEKQVEESTSQLQEVEKQYRSLFEESKDMVFISDSEGKLIDINPAGVEILRFQSKQELLGLGSVLNVYSNTRDEVAEKAELSKGTLYLYFKNKNDLFHAIVARALEILFNLFQRVVENEEKGIDKIKAIGAAYFEFYKTNSDYYSAMLHQEVYEFDQSDVAENPNIALCQQLGEKIFGLMREGVKTGIMDGSIRKDLDPAKLPIVLWRHAAGVLHLVKSKGKMLEEKFDCSCEEIIEYSFRLIRQYMENKE